MTTKTFEHLCYLESEDKEYTLTISCCFTNTGIGPYEYWGAKFFDKGEDVVEDITLESATLNGVLVKDEKILALLETWVSENIKELEQAAFEPEDI
jgi:hypothetical protein